MSYAAPQFSLSLNKQYTVVVAPASLRPPSQEAHLVLIGQRSEAARWETWETPTVLEAISPQIIKLIFPTFFSF